MPRLISAAVPTRWMAPMFWYHLSDHEVGGNSMKAEPPTLTSAVKNTGNSRKSSTAQPAAAIR
jgi:hypothetical protein